MMSVFFVDHDCHLSMIVGLLHLDDHVHYDHADQNCHQISTSYSVLLYYQLIRKYIYVISNYGNQPLGTNGLAMPSLSQNSCVCGLTVAVTTVGSAHGIT